MLHLSGEYSTYTNGKSKVSYKLEYYNDERSKVLDVYAGGVLSSSYKVSDGIKYIYSNANAMNIYQKISDSLKICSSSSRTAYPVAFPLGVAIRVEKKRGTAEYIVDRYGKELAGIEVTDKDYSIYLGYVDEDIVYHDINYIELSSKMDAEFQEQELEIPVRSLSEISVFKDISWLKDKQYFVVNDDNTAEQIFKYLDTYNGIIAYDTETTGLKINAFSKINSKYQKMLEEYNKDKEKDDRIRVDSLVGIIFCVEPNISYYFPCKNRKYKNLYEDKESEIRKRLIQNIKADYTIGKYRQLETDMADYWRNNSDDDVTSDCLLMERCRNILTTRHICAHNGSFDWKVSYCYDIDINLKDDTMIMHQLLYKFRNAISDQGEQSNLKYLSYAEFGVYQLDLSDFFVDFKEDNKYVRGNGKKKKKNNIRIDFSYMDLAGSRAYAPADGDLTLQLCIKYKKDLLENHREIEYIYNVEVMVACAVGYMEFYGHRLDERKIEAVKISNKRKLLDLEHKIRVEANYSSDAEDEIFKEIGEYNELVKSGLIDSEEMEDRLDELYNKAREIIDNSENVLNLASPVQVANLFFDRLQIPFSGDKYSVAEKVLKGYLKQRNEDGSPKYPAINYYREWKDIDTLLTKFFEKLPNFMYPGGFIFPKYGQNSTATGRMSSKEPNAQQYPKDITRIVIPRDNNVMLDADFSQIEYRTLVAMAKEPHLAKLFEDPDSDYHTMMASLMYGVEYSLVTPKMRGDAKSFNFGIPYGMGFASLAILLTGSRGPAQIAEAKEKYELYFKEQPNVRRFFEKVKEMALVNKYTKTYWNRRRYYSFTDKDGKISEAKKASAMRQAGNAVIQGSAADIYKIAVARTYKWIRDNSLYGDVLIVNMVHDEQLIEINCDKINVQRAFRDIVKCMEFKIDGFPPLYVGAGISNNCADAKGKMAEIHPSLAEKLSMEVENVPIRTNKGMEAAKVIEYFNNRVYEFRVEKVRDYILDTSKHNQALNPVIGSLLNLQFTDGLEKEFSGNELTRQALKHFIDKYELGIDYRLFEIPVDELNTDDEEEVGYSDGDKEDELEDLGNTAFQLVDESDKLFGSTPQDLIKEFGVIVSKSLKICGIDMGIVPYKEKDGLVDYLCSHQVEDGRIGMDGAVEIVFLQSSNTLFRTNVWVDNINRVDIIQRYKLMAMK